MIDYLAQLDGVSEKAIRKLAEHHSIKDWLEIPDGGPGEYRPGGKKRVRNTLH